MDSLPNPLQCIPIIQLTYQLLVEAETTSQLVLGQHEKRYENAKLFFHLLFFLNQC